MAEQIKSLEREPIDMPEQGDPDPSYQSGEHLPNQPYPSPDGQTESGQHLPTTPDPTKNKPTPIDDLRPDVGPHDSRPNDGAGWQPIGRRRAS